MKLPYTGYPIGLQGEEVELGDTVGIKEPNLYTGVGTVKAESRGIVVDFALEGRAVIVQFPLHPGTTMLFVRDLVVYEKGVA